MANVEARVPTSSHLAIEQICLSLGLRWSGRSVIADPLIGDCDINMVLSLQNSVKLHSTLGQYPRIDTNKMFVGSAMNEITINNPNELTNWRPLILRP